MTPTAAAAPAIRAATVRPGAKRARRQSATASETALGWAAEHDFAAGLRRTVAWYLGQRDWWTGLRARGYRGERLGRAG